MDGVILELGNKYEQEVIFTDKLAIFEYKMCTYLKASCFLGGGKLENKFLEHVCSLWNVRLHAK